MTETQNKLYAPIGLWVFVFVMLAVIGGNVIGGSLPYLFTKKITLIRAFIIFPLLFVFLIYFAFFHKWITSGRTSFRMRFTKEELANPYIKAKYFLLSFFGCMAMSAGIAWISWGVVACAASLYSKEPINKTYKIRSFWGAGSIGVDVGLINLTNGSEYTVNEQGYYLNLGVPWKVGDIVCAKGRTSVLGTIVDELKAGSCE